MTRFTNYRRDSFPNARLARSDNGVLEVSCTRTAASWSSTAIHMSSLLIFSTPLVKTTKIGS